MRHSNRALAAALIAAAVSLAASPARAQEQQPPVPKARTPTQAVQHPLSPPPPSQAPTVVSGASAYQTFNELQQMLQRYPPSVRRV
ncbi:MAG TPA: hypothetical protein VG871_11920, partial [Vicinamibacterales bacterium]|nr:hypothetical protein [Vicinamibacterales bacterium]